jgi:PAS domain S-box-containing protein
LRDDHGRAVGLVGVAEDITERHQAEQALAASRRLLQAVFDTVPAHLYVKDLQGRYVMVNRARANFDGDAPEALAGKTIAQLPRSTEESVRKSDGEDQTVLREGKRVNLAEFLRADSHGQPRWLRGVKLPLRDDGGNVMGLIGMVEDVTERHQAEEQVRAARRLLHAVFDTIPLRMAVKNRTGRYIMVNRAHAAAFGGTEADNLGKRLDELAYVDPAEREALRSADQAVMETKALVDIPALRWTDVSGAERYRHLMKFPLLDEQGEVDAIVSVSEDITERLHTEQALGAGRRLLQTILDTIPHSLFVKDREGRFIMVNHAMARFNGMEPRQMIGLRSEDMGDRFSTALPAIVESDAAVVRSGERVDMPEVSMRDADGKEQWVRAVKLPLRDEQGRIMGVVAVSEVVTEQRRAEEALRANRRLLRTVVDHLPLWVTVRDREGHFVMLNRAMAEAFGLSVTDAPTNSLADGRVVRPEEARALDEMFERVRASRQPVTAPEMGLTLPRGEARTVRIALIPLLDGAGAYDGALTVVEDITDRKKQELALLHAQKMESLGVMAGGIAHDFNNLLVSVLGNVSLALLKLPADTPVREELGQIEVAGQRAADLCRQMLAYAGKGRLERVPVNLNQLVQEMTQLVRVSLPKPVSLNFRLAAELPLLEGDPTQLRQVIMNLVINAGEAIGEKPGTITLSSGVIHVDDQYLLEAHMAMGQDPKEGDYVFLEVSDSGSGMSPETRARIFDPFFTTKFTGRGLGLASVLGIIRGHQGGLKVYSVVGRGTSFKVLLPVALGTAAAPPRADPKATWTGAGTVLVVDDESAIRSVTVRMLNVLGFQVIEAADGAAAVELLRQDPAAVYAVLLDLTMPGMSGEETLGRLRAVRGDLPVIVLSGYSEKDVMDRFAGRELAGFLQKPFKLDALRERLRLLAGEGGV